MSDTDRIDEAFERVVGNNEAYRLGRTSGTEKPDDCLELMALCDAIPENRDKLIFWYNFGRKEINHE